MPGYNGYIYRNESISEENFKMVVTVFAVGQGSCNTIEIMDGDKLVYLACIDLGTSSGKDYINIYDEDYGPIEYLKERMKKRASDGGMGNAYYAYMDMFFLTHQDADHHNKLPHLIKALDDEQQGSNKKTKYINEMYLGGFDYMVEISQALGSGGMIGKAVNHMYHITQDNSQNAYGYIGNRGTWEKERGIQADGDVEVCLNWLFSCGCTNQTFDKPGRFPKPGIRTRDTGHPGLPYNFHNGKCTANAHTKNQSSTLLCLCVTFPSRTEEKMVCFLFPGDAELATFKAVQAINLPDLGTPLLFLMPHHGAHQTALTKGNQYNDKFHDLKEFIKKLCSGKKIKLAVASSAVVHAPDSYDHYHPNNEVVRVFESYCENEQIMPDLNACYVVSQHAETKKGFVETKKETKTVCTTEFVVDKTGGDIISNLDNRECETQEKANEKSFKLHRRKIYIELTAGGRDIGAYNYDSGEMTSVVLPVKNRR